LTDRVERLRDRLAALTADVPDPERRTPCHSSSDIDPGAWEGPTREEDRREEPKTAEEEHGAEEEREEKPSS
jgi:hypothetical protein